MDHYSYDYMYERYLPDPLYPTFSIVNSIGIDAAAVGERRRVLTLRALLMSDSRLTPIVLTSRSQNLIEHSYSKYDMYTGCGRGLLVAYFRVRTPYVLRTPGTAGTPCTVVMMARRRTHAGLMINSLWIRLNVNTRESRVGYGAYDLACCGCAGALVLCTRDEGEPSPQL